MAWSFMQVLSDGSAPSPVLIPYMPGITFLINRVPYRYCLLSTTSAFLRCLAKCFPLAIKLSLDIDRARGGGAS